MAEPSRKKQKTGNFWDMNFEATEADEGADEEDEEGWEMEEQVDEATLERHRREVEERYKRRSAPTLNPDILNPRRESMPNLLERLQQKYTNPNQGYADDQSVVASEYGTSNQANHPNSIYPVSTMHNGQSSRQPSRAVYHHGQSSLSVQATLPSVQDPNLWLVPCLPGRERYAVEELLKKYFKYLHHTTKKLFIKTAFTTDMNTGYIYVEAYKEIHVRRACEDISGLSNWKLRLVPRNEMVDALTIKAAGPQIKRGQWCRFQRGLYKGDLAQVYAIMDQGSKVVLRVVPRIDYGKLSIMNSRDDRRGKFDKGNPAFMRKGRPPQKLFNTEEIAMYDDGARAPEVINNDAILQTRIIKWRGKKYKNGCHLITTPVNQVEFDVTASPEEVQLLRAKTGDEDYDDVDGDMDEVAPPILQKTCQFVRGDTVKVIRGAMTNLIGEVLTTQPNPVSGKITVTVLPEHKDLMEAIMFPADELQKYFKVGCHVKVKRGKFKDETGLIIKVEEEGSSSNNDSKKKKKDGDQEGEVIIFSDLTSRTIRVHINDITETSEVSTGRDVLGNYALYELVHLSRDVVGVIVSIQNGTFKILDNKDQIQTCRLPDIARHSRDEHAVALDIDNNQIRIGDVIIPQVGDFKSQRATVKHVYRSVLFCHTKSCTVNSGIFVCRSRLCRQAGGRMRMNNASISQQGRSDTKNDRRLRILHKHRSSRDPWMHKTVKVKRGSYKGMIGIVCGCTDQKLHIELHAKCKKIQVKREDVKVINQDGTDIDDNPYSNFNSRNNGRGGRDSWRNNNNNNGGGSSWRDNRDNNRNGNRGGRDQWRGNNGRRNYRGNHAQTPMIGVHTPAYDNLGAATPAIGSQTPAMGSQTPGYGGLTPAYGSGGGGGGSSAWNVGGMTPAHNPQTPSSPMYGDGHNPPPSTHSHHSNTGQYSHHSVNTPSRHGGITPSHDYNHHEDNHNHNMDSTSNSENEQDIDKALSSDPYYFIIENAVLSYNGQFVVIKELDKSNNVCSIASPQSPSDIYQRNVPLSHIIHTVSHQDMSNAKVKVVYGKLQGEIGSLIGIDNEEAVVQLTSTTEVTIIAKKLVVIYIDPDE